MIRTIIIDDEPKAIDVLQKLVSKYCPEVEIMDIASSVEEAQQKINLLHPQLLLLDIDLGAKSGFDLLRSFPEGNFKVIFVSGFPNEAINAIKANALDFVTKPVSQDDLILAIEKAKKKIEDELSSNEWKHLMDKERKLRIPQIDGVLFENIYNIMYLEADGYCTNFYRNDGKKIVSSFNIKTYEAFLTENYSFFRIHNSYLVNKKYIIKIQSQGDIGIVVMQDEAELPISRNRKRDFLAWMGSENNLKPPTIR